MSEQTFCNASAVSAAEMSADCHPESDGERVVTLALGNVDEQGRVQEILACITLEPQQAREMAQELLSAAAQVEGTDPLPRDVTIDQPVGRC